MSSSKKLHFVIQKHYTKTHHYDLRLQQDDLLLSWAVPKGPSLDPSVKRLAMRTPDHSLEYRHFEGVIPPESYGAGVVMIWDDGTYLPEIEISRGERKIIDDLEEADSIITSSLEQGELKFTLWGKRLKGSFALIKTKNFGPKNAWLLIKHKDAYSCNDYNIDVLADSVSSGRTMEEIIRLNG